VLDESQEVAKAYGAVCTPDFFGYNAALELQYRGRLDASRKDAAPEGAPRDCSMPCASWRWRERARAADPGHRLLDQVAEFMRVPCAGAGPAGHAPALADDNVLLIQLQPGGAYKVWHTEGESQLTDEDVMALEATASKEGGKEMATGFGPARAFETPDGIVISLPAAPGTISSCSTATAAAMCGCGTAGATNLPEDGITDIFMSALPGGGKRVTVDDYHVKASSPNWGSPPRSGSSSRSRDAWSPTCASIRREPSLSMNSTKAVAAGISRLSVR
jgi:hypothetical protein